MTDRAAPPRLVWLDLWRGVAAMSVACLHASRMFSLSFAPVHAYLAVDFFFLLSGYVLARSYEQKLIGPGFAGRFLVHRLRRLYPMVIVGVALGAVTLGVRSLMRHDISGLELGVEITLALVLLPVPVIRGFLYAGYPVNPVFWSIFFEFFINAVYALVTRWLNNLVLLIVILACGLALALRVGLGEDLDVGFVNFAWGFPRVGFSFAIGVLLQRSDRTPLTWPGGMQVAVGVGLGAILCGVLLRDAHPDGLADLACVALLFPAIVVLGGRMSAPPFWAAVCGTVGELSYPLYAVSHPVTRVLANVAVMRHAPVSMMPALMLVSLAVATGVAYAAWRFVDVPLRRQGWRARPRIAPTQAATAP